MSIVTAVLFAQLMTPGVSISGFTPPSGEVSARQKVSSSIVIENAGRADATVWVGYSVMSPGGLWFDVPASMLVVPAGAARKATKVWSVTDSAEGGDYRAVMAIWSAPPEAGGAVRLASVERLAAFRVKGNPELLVNQPDSLWRAGTHRLGRGRMRPDQVKIAGNGFELRVLGGTCDGAEIRTNMPFSFGSYSIGMRTPVAPGSISTFFLYGSNSGDKNDEIDIEIFNDGSRDVLLTAWKNGRETNQSTVKLPFDPAAEYHNYTIRWSVHDLEFLADDRRLARWTQRYPKSPMRVMASVWYPHWLQCSPGPLDAKLEIQRITLAPDQ